ncbi:putative short-chain dehydrogenase reductase sdr [Diaporthe ampelina]|uniref:Putative short-chain dehydrogenase reductase sdr n=1 Tax=Diaporthe ampelina TaxID=1214573 RepID=A0A0G2FSX9_9PEZI|nr:putative short-chain dehydrogenase reductase sdr [Diaporthe ampelina]
MRPIAAWGAAVESLGVESKPLGIKTLLIEPGCFRTGFVDEKNAVYVNSQIDDRKPPVDREFARFKGAYHKQPGDRAEGVARIIEMVMSDAAEGEIPISLALGEAALGGIRNKCTSTLELPDKWAGHGSIR